MRLRRRVVLTIVAAAALTASLAVAPSAFGLGFTGLSTTPASDQAGANSNLAINIGFTSPGDQVRNLTIGLAPGIVGNPNAAVQCTEEQLAATPGAGGCPAGSVVGAVSTSFTVLGLPLPAVTGSLYNVVPRAGEPARFGVVLVPPLGGILLENIVLPSAVRLRQSDFGLDTVIEDIPNTADTTLGLGVPINITEMTVELFGTVGGQGFIRNPTSCDEAITRFTATSYSGPTTVTPATGQASFDPQGCDQLEFSPTFTAKAGGQGMTAQGSLTPVTTSIDQDATEAGLRRAEVITPADFGANVARLGDVCSSGAFQSGACPANSRVGSAIATSPLLTSPLTGPVVLVDTEDLPNIGLNLTGPLTLNLQGTLGFDNRVIFEGLPDIPISHFELQFAGGTGGLLFANRDLCKPPAPLFTGNFTSHAGGTQPFAQSASVEGCGPSKAAGKCKKAKKKSKKGKKSEAAAAKKKKSCKRKKKRKKKR